MFRASVCVACTGVLPRATTSDLIGIWNISVPQVVLCERCKAKIRSEQLCLDLGAGLFTGACDARVVHVCRLVVISFKVPFRVVPGLREDDVPVRYVATALIFYGQST